MNKMKRYAKLIVPAIAGASFAAPVSAVTCTSITSGNWDARSTWGLPAIGCIGATGGIPGSADDVIIRNGNTVTIRTNALARNVNVGQGINGTLRYDRNGNYSLTVGNGTAGNGNFTVNTGAQVTLRTANNQPNRTHTLLLQGNFSNGGTVTTYATSPNGARIFVLNVTMNGAAAQTLGGAALTTFNDLTISNTGSGVTINSASVALSPAVNGILTLTSGHVFTTVGTNVLALTTAGTVPGGGSNTSHVVGDVQKNFLTGNSSFTFPIGDGTNYQPVTVALTGVTTAGSLTGHVNSGDHPDTIANVTRIDQTNSANHYWTLTPGTLAGGSYIPTFQFCATTTCSVPAERDTLVPLVPNTAPNNFIVARKIAGAWTRPTVGVIAANTIEATGGVTAAQGFGEFAVGIPLAGVYKGVNQLIDLRELY